MPEQSRYKKWMLRWIRAILFAIVIPTDFQRDLKAGRRPTIQINIDATVMSQSFIGANYIQQIFAAELNEYLTGNATARHCLSN